MADLVWLIPAFPLAGFLVILVLGRKLGEPKSGYVAAAAAGAAFVTSIAVFADLMSMDAEERTHRAATVLWSWVPVGSLQVDLAFLADPLSMTMALFVTGIGTLIHLYAIGYMHGDPKFSKFFLYLNLFVLSMLVLILGSNMLVTFLGWEGVGACSYFLISFWHTRESAATAGKKAFVTNRVGDWGFMIAMFLAFQAVGSLDYAPLNEAAHSGSLAKSTATAISMMLFVGACGKSAQLPLYIWLPDAMEGPTPVSALIHAATMVTAGVYLMTRTGAVLQIGSYEWATWVVAGVGAATALFAATIAVAQNDIKKVLAYSTVSQLGYMFLAVGSGAYVAAIFHMVTHAFFKALLFLGSGSVIHGMHHEQDIRKMGALRKLMPVTAITFIIGWLAIAGFPGLSGFWSKDEILLFAFDKSPVLWAVGLVTALLTAYYMTRQVMMVFFTEARWESHAEEHGAHGEFKPHESPRLMLFPLVVLAGLSVVGGFIQLPFSHSTKLLEQWLEPVVEGAERHLSDGADSAKWALMGVAILIALTGMAAGVAVYQLKKAKAIEPALFANGWNFDKGITAFMGGPGRQVFEQVAWLDKNVVDGAVNGSATGVRTIGSFLRKAQSGFVRNYALGISTGVIALLAWFLIRGVL
jgi:NADH-quinone oxidoreductase subunit L